VITEQLAGRAAPRWPGRRRRVRVSIIGFGQQVSRMPPDGGQESVEPLLGASTGGHRAVLPGSSRAIWDRVLPRSDPGLPW